MSKLLDRAGWEKNKLTLLLAAGLVTEVLYLVAFVLPYRLTTYYDQPLLDMTKISDATRPAAWSFGVSTVVLFILSYLVLRLCLGTRLADSQTGKLLVFLLPALFAVTLMLVYPIGAADIFGYIFYGRIMAQHHANPFILPPNSFAGDPFLAYTAWRNEASTYGPVWMLLSGAASLLAGNSLVLNLIVFKTLALAFYAGDVALIYLTLRASPRLALGGAALFAWNPLVLFETAANGHNDATMLFFVLLAVFLLARRVHPSFAVASVMLSVLVKFVTAAVMPASLVVGLFRGRGPRGWVIFLASSAALTALVTVALFAPFWEGTQVLGPLRRTELFTASIPAYIKTRLQTSMGEKPAENLVRQGAMIVFGLYALVMTVRVRSSWQSMVRASFEIMFFYLMFACLWFQPWYLVWVVALGALLPATDAGLRAIVFSLSATLGYLIWDFIWVWHWDTMPWQTANLLAVLTIYPLPFLASVVLLWRGRGRLSPVPEPAPAIPNRREH